MSSSKPAARGSSDDIDGAMCMTVFADFLKRDLKQMVEDLIVLCGRFVKDGEDIQSKGRKAAGSAVIAGGAIAASAGTTILANAVVTAASARTTLLLGTTIIAATIVTATGAGLYNFIKTRADEKNNYEDFEKKMREELRPLQELMTTFQKYMEKILETAHSVEKFCRYCII